MKVFRAILLVGYYIIVFPIISILIILYVVISQMFRTLQENYLLKKMCNNKVHSWTHFSEEINGVKKNYRKCLRCNKKQLFRPNKGYKDE